MALRPDESVDGRIGRMTFCGGACCTSSRCQSSDAVSDDERFVVAHRWWLDLLVFGPGLARQQPVVVSDYISGVDCVSLCVCVTGDDNMH